MTYRVVWTAGALLLALTALAAAQAGAETCAVALSLSPADQQVRVDPGVGGRTELTGTYSVAAAPDTPTKLRFEAQASSAWPVETLPNEVDLGDLQPLGGPFNVSVLVPSNATAGRPVTVTVVGRALAGGTECALAVATALVVPLPYYEELRVTPASTLVDVDPVTSVARVELTLRALSNDPGPVDVRLTVRSDAGLEHDAPAEVTLIQSAPGVLEAQVTVSFWVEAQAPARYTVSLFATPPDTGTPGLRQFWMSTIAIRVPEQPVNLGVVALTSVGSLVTVAGLAWWWFRTRPVHRKGVSGDARHW